MALNQNAYSWLDRLDGQTLVLIRLLWSLEKGIRVYDLILPYLGSVTQSKDVSDMLCLGPRDAAMVKVSQMLEKLQQEYEAETRIYAADVDLQLVNQDFYNGMLSLKNLILLTNPFAVQAVERAHRFNRTGKLESLERSWHRRYFSPSRCLEFNTSESCMIKAARYGDGVIFCSLFADRKTRLRGSVDAAMAATQFGHVHIIEKMREFGYIDTSVNMLLHTAFRAEHDNTQMISYLIGLGIHRLNEVPFSYISWGGSHINNIRFLIQLVRDTGNQEKFRQLVISTCEQTIDRGYLDFFKELAQMVEIEPQTWDRFFTHGIVEEKTTISQFLADRKSPNYRYVDVLYELLVHRRERPDAIARVLAMPEISQEVICQFVRETMANNVFGIDNVPVNIQNYLIGSGKMTSILLEGETVAGWDQLDNF